MAETRSKPTVAELRAAISETAQRFGDAWNRHDARALAAAFARDADFTNVAGAHVRGRDKIQAMHAKLFSGVFRTSRQTALVRSIRMFGPDIAAVDLDWEMEGLVGRDGQPRPVRRGLMSWVLGRTVAGEWLILIMHNIELSNSPR